MKNIFFFALLLLTLASCQSSNIDEREQMQRAESASYPAPNVDFGKTDWLKGDWKSDRGMAIHIEEQDAVLNFDISTANGTVSAHLFADPSNGLMYEQNGQKWRVIWTGERDIRMEPLGKNKATPLTWVKVSDEHFFLIRHGANDEMPESFTRSKEIIP